MGKWKKTMGRALLACMLMAVVLPHSAADAFAAGRAEVAKQVEASMLVTGTIDIDAAGSVTSYHVEQAEVLSKAVLDFVDQSVRKWRFEPVLVDGKAKPARARMQLRLVLKQDGENYQARISGATFGRLQEGSLARGKLRPPPYPKEAVFKRVGGTVYLVLQVGRDGTVQDVVAEQVNLRVIDNGRAMAVYREMLSRAAMNTARKWLFDFPTQGEDADAQFISLRVPVDFIAPDMPQEKVGEWYAYVPGPRQPVPWRNWDAALHAPDAIAAGGVYQDRPNGLRLLTDLGG
jgi:hypothetical protein